MDKFLPRVARSAREKFDKMESGETDCINDCENENVKLQFARH